MLRRALLAAAGAAPALYAVSFAQSPIPRAQLPPAPARPAPVEIQPENALERDFLAAFADEAMRPAFRLRLLESQVALALANSAPNAPPRVVAEIGGAPAHAIFTSAARHAAVFGPAAPHQMLSGRAALTRLSGQHVALNFGLLPMLTLEPEDVARLLETPA